MQQSGKGIESIQPSCKKWEQKWTDGIFSFVFFGISFVNAKNGEMKKHPALAVTNHAGLGKKEVSLY